MSLRWSEPRKPTATGPGGNWIPYNHVVSEIAVGEILITWKAWKDPIFASFYVEFPEGWPWGGAYDSLEEAKQGAQLTYDSVVASLHAETADLKYS